MDTIQIVQTVLGAVITASVVGVYIQLQSHTAHLARLTTWLEQHEKLDMTRQDTIIALFGVIRGDIANFLKPPIPVIPVAPTDIHR